MCHVNMWNPFKKIKSSVSAAETGPHTKNNEKNNMRLKDKFFGVGVNMLQKIAMKKLEKMSPEERNKVMQDALKPENKDKLMAAMEQMKASGQITEEQYRMAKEKMGM